MIHNIGIGMRRNFSGELLEGKLLQPHFIELAPENWMGMGGHFKRVIKAASEKYPITAHGLSLSIGSQEELDYDFLKNVKSFLDEFHVQIYSEHLSFSKAANAHLYDLLPIPFREDAVRHIVHRIKEVQDFLERENIHHFLL